MKHADEVLVDELLVAAVYEALAKRRPKSRSRGRQGVPAEVVLRLLILKQRSTDILQQLISPILANVYLHYVFDLWAHRCWRACARRSMRWFRSSGR